MNIDLAEMYGTPGAEEAIEEREKVAQYELFAKLAADNDIDLGELSDEQVSDLWDATFGEEKTAEEKCETCGKAECECPAAKSESKDEGEKTSAAEIEFLQEKEWTEKMAEADFLGRQMAHAYVDELGSIGEAMDKEAGKAADIAMKVPLAVERLEGAAGKASKYLKGKGESAGKYLKGKAEAGGRKVRSAAKATDTAAQRAGERIVGGVTRSGGGEKALSPRTKRLVGYGAAGTGAAGAGAGGYAMSKNSSASLDELAFESAVEKAAEAGWDAEEAADRINAVFTLGMFDEENTKIAAAEDVEGAIEIRSLEMLEQAGYDVEWG